MTVINPGLYTIAKSGDTPLSGNVTLSAGSGITLTEVGQNIAIAATGIGGSGTINTIAKFTASTTIGDSAITDDGTTVTIANGKNTVFGQTTGKVGIGGLVSGSDYLVQITGDSTQNWSRVVNITQANNANEQSSTMVLTNTVAPGTPGSTPFLIKNLDLSMTPTLTANNSGLAQAYGLYTELFTSAFTLKDSVDSQTTLELYGARSSLVGSPVINNASSLADQTQFVSVGFESSVTITPVLTAVADLVHYSYAGSFINNTSVSGNANLTSNAYGIRIQALGSLSTLGTTAHYGAAIIVGGTADVNYGLLIESVASGTANIGIQISTVAAGATHYALYSSATAQSYFAGKVGIGVAAPTAGLSLLASATGAASLQITAGTAPTTPNEGDIWNDTSQKVLMQFIDGIKGRLVSCIFTGTADKTVTNTVTETSVVPTGVGTITLPTNFFVVGKTLRLRIGGIYTTPLAATPSVIVKVKYGSTVIATVTTTSLLSGATNLEFDGEALITCRTIGTSGTVVVHGDIEYATGVGGTIAVNSLNNAGATTTINTTTSNALDVTVTWDTNTTTRSITTTVCEVEVLN